MEALYSLLHSLTSPEWKAFQNYLTCFTDYNPAHLKQLHLAKMLSEKVKCPTSDECCIALYATKKSKGFKMLKSRLKEKLHEFLLCDISDERPEGLDEADYATIKIKTKSALFQKLHYSKTRTNYFNELLDEIIQLGKEYEHYSSLVDHLRLKKSFTGFKVGTKEFETISREIEKYWKLHRMVYLSEHYYHQLIALGDFSSRPDDKRVSAFFKKAIPELEIYYWETKSPTIKYHLTFLKLGFHSHCRDYMRSRSICLELLGIVRNNKSVYRRQRIGIVYDNLSHYEFHIGRYRQAAEWAHEAQKYFNAGSENYCIALEQEFYALYAMKRFDKAVEAANKMLTSASREELGEFRCSKYNYLLANVLFKQGRFKDAFHLLSQERDFSEDKAGWETGARTLTIMTLIEFGKSDEAGLAVRSLKQFFKRTGKKDPIGLRDKKILNLLLILERKGFDFTLVKGAGDKYLKPLSSNDQLLQWKPFTHEVIPFHQWFEGKMNVKKRLTSLAEQHPKEKYQRV